MYKVYLRKAGWADVDLLFEWANDREVRNNSFNTIDIIYDDHKQWFENCMLNKDVDIYICCLDDDSVGQIRLNYNDKNAVISYSIAKQFRGQGFGRTIIKLIEAEVVINHLDIMFLSGSVKSENIASQRIFEENGFEKEFAEDGNKYFIYSKKIVSTNADR